MKLYYSKRNTVLTLSAIFIALTLLPVAPALAQMMGGMREMMQRMMGDVLPPGIDPKLLPDPGARGAHLLERYCSQCHNLPGPGMHTAAEWPAVVQRMNGRMQMMSGGMMKIHAPSAAELSALLAYLQKHAQKPMDVAQYPDLNTPAGKTFHAVCTQCHALPDPKQHTANEWPAVVTRMKKNMSIMGKKVPDAAATEAITGFLQHHALAGK
ncbi:MAG: c-type cytochrome [Sulfuricaulis sp.]